MNNDLQHHCISPDSGQAFVFSLITQPVLDFSYWCNVFSLQSIVAYWMYFGLISLARVLFAIVGYQLNAGSKGHVRRPIRANATTAELAACSERLAKAECAAGLL